MQCIAFHDNLAVPRRVNKQSMAKEAINLQLKSLKFNYLLCK